MPKWGAVGLGSDAADIDPDSVGNVYDEATNGIPPKGPYLFSVKRFEAGETGPNSETPGTPKVTVLCEIAEPAGTAKARYNGYGTWKHLPLTEKGAGRINQLLLALLDNSKLTAAQKKAVLKAFHDIKVVVDKPDGRGQQTIQKIGTWTVPEGMLVGGLLLVEKGDGDARYISSFMPKSEAPKGKKADLVEDDDEPDDDDVDEAVDEEVAAREEELGEMTIAKLKSVAKNLGLTVKRGATEDDIINAILDEEFPEDAPEDDDADEPDEDDDEPDDDATEEGDEFDEMDRAALKKYNAAEALGIKVTTKMTDDELRDAIRDAVADMGAEPEEVDEDEEDEEDEEEPAKPARRGARAAKATPAAKTRPAARRRAGQKDDPPF